jgi:hypothetical protein
MRTSLLIFACEGREHLLEETYTSLRESVQFDFDKTILSFDGECTGRPARIVQPDVFLQSPKRKGYVPSIRRAIRHVDTEFFFWLEDDWKFNVDISLEHYLEVFSSQPSSSQLLFLKREYSSKDAGDLVDDHVYVSKVGFSANPSLNRTKDIRHSLNATDQTSSQNIEHYVTDWARKNDRQFLVAALEGETFVDHLGMLEATGGNWHTVKGGKQTNSEDQSSASFGSRTKMLIRLTVRSIYLSLMQMVDPEAHSLAWRVTNVIKRFKMED